MARGRRGKSQGHWLAKVVIPIALLVAPVGYVGYLLKDRFDHAAAEPRAKAAWPAARNLVAGRLKQPEPLEFGAVWATHNGSICGLVNGYGSFGGLTGMTPFYVQDGKATFALEVTAGEFADGWRRCSGDNWIQILPGSTEAGWCATRRGQLKCKQPV